MILQTFIQLLHKIQEIEFNVDEFIDFAGSFIDGMDDKLTVFLAKIFELVCSG
ncbi:hypothetical protein PESP_a1715 [Pseudoalteromonas espejiana DSM 9414]|nr:hypothetical protein PESP_a1715 [Pseudoalteromonas espejiana DSM 9414]